MNELIIEAIDHKLLISLNFVCEFWSAGGIQDLGHSFSQYGPPVWWITYIWEEIWKKVSIVWSLKLK